MNFIRKKFVELYDSDVYNSFAEKHSLSIADRLVFAVANSKKFSKDVILPRVKFNINNDVKEIDGMKIQDLDVLLDVFNKHSVNFNHLIELHNNIYDSFEDISTETYKLVLEDFARKELDFKSYENDLHTLLFFVNDIDKLNTVLKIRATLDSGDLQEAIKIYNKLFKVNKNLKEVEDER